MDIAGKIKAAEAAGVTQSEIAERAGVTHSVINRISVGGRAKTRFLEAAVDNAIDASLRCLKIRKDAADAVAALTAQERIDLAARLGFAPQTVRNWGSGMALPPWRRIGPIMAALRKIKT